MFKQVLRHIVAGEHYFNQIYTLSILKENACIFRIIYLINSGLTRFKRRSTVGTYLESNPLWYNSCVGGVDVVKLDATDEIFKFLNVVLKC